MKNDTRFEKGHIPWNKKYFTTKDKIRRRKITRKLWRIQNKEKIKFYSKMHRARGLLSIETIQKIYEDNIKQFGTLTCIYCLKPIKFGKDTLDHKHPLSRGGTHKYKNLAIACYSCNSTKRNKTEKEYRQYLLI